MNWWVTRLLTAICRIPGVSNQLTLILPYTRGVYYLWVKISIGLKYGLFLCIKK